MLLLKKSMKNYGSATSIQFKSQIFPQSYLYKLLLFDTK
ncbi:unnamed protein product [Paramecium pentaurelia]|uniref:Uncharacterized protein n=1 Tax=Paramecium pentaurelia TaxID=43138 RepID=A0A8S1YDH3_9CILI|nr:unnamed protein product [Paramecium pentaurelia]